MIQNVYFILIPIVHPFASTLEFLKVAVLVKLSIAGKRHYDHDKSYKGKYLIGAGLQFRG